MTRIQNSWVFGVLLIHLSAGCLHVGIPVECQISYYEVATLIQRANDEAEDALNDDFSVFVNAQIDNEVHHFTARVDHRTNALAWEDHEHGASGTVSSYHRSYSDQDGEFSSRYFDPSFNPLELIQSWLEGPDIDRDQIQLRPYVGFLFLNEDGSLAVQGVDPERWEDYTEEFHCEVSEGRELVTVASRNQPKANGHLDWSVTIDRDMGRAVEIVQDTGELHEASGVIRWTWAEQTVEPRIDAEKRPADLTFVESTSYNDGRLDLIYSSGLDDVSFFRIAFHPTGEQPAQWINITEAGHSEPGGWFSYQSNARDNQPDLFGGYSEAPEGYSPGIFNVWTQSGWNFTIWDGWADQPAGIYVW